MSTLYYYLFPKDLRGEFPYGNCGVYRKQKVAQMLKEHYMFDADKRLIDQLKGAWIIDADTMKLIKTIKKQAAMCDSAEDHLNIACRIIAKRFGKFFIKK